MRSTICLNNFRFEDCGPDNLFNEFQYKTFSLQFGGLEKRMREKVLKKKKQINYLKMDILIKIGIMQGDKCGGIG